MSSITTAGRGRSLLLAGLLLSALVFAGGCAGLALLASYAAAASTIKSVVDYFDPDEPTYKLYGWVYIDRDANKIAVRGDGTLPGGGSYQPYTEAEVRVDTAPPRSTKTDTVGYFEFRGIPEADKSHVLTIVTPDDGRVQFVVTVTGGVATIIPLANS